MASDRKRAILVNLNAETDFVAKGDAFKEFLSNTLKLLLDKQLNVSLNKGDPNIEGLLKDLKYDSGNTLEEARKLLTAKTKENIEFGQITGIEGSHISSSQGRRVYRQLRPQRAARLDRIVRLLDIDTARA